MCREIQKTTDAFHSLLITEHDTSDDSKVINIDENLDHLLLCPEIGPEIFENLRALERKKSRPERQTQVDKNRGYQVDWVVDIVETLGFSKETLYYGIRYFDWCLMGKEADKSKTNLLSLACFILASKYEETRCPSITLYAEQYNFSSKQIIEMERSVIKCLGYDLSYPTTWSFMERCIRAAQGGSELRHMASYVAELSLYSYNINSYLPSMVAASSVFLAKYILHPSKIPWTPTLQYYMSYKPSDLQDCVLELLDIATGKANYNFFGIKDKYSRFVYHRVALKVVPLSIPVEFFKGI